MAIPVSDLENRFTYHPPKDAETAEKYAAIRDECRKLSLLINLLVPDGREKALAITKLEEVMFWANAGIARNSNDD